MAKQQLDGAHIGAAFQQVSRERVPQRVWISCRSRHEIHYAENPDMPSGGKRPRFPVLSFV